MTSRTFLIGLVGFFMLMSCKKEKEIPRLPEETQGGFGMFGCLVNGELVIQEGKSWGWVGPGPYVRPGRPPFGVQDSEGRFKLVAYVEYRHTFEFFISQPKVGQCVIDSVFFWTASGHYYAERDVQHIYFTRFDSIASGTFMFDADYYDRQTHTLIPDKKIQVRKGRFDVRIGTINW
ncbi:MAG: hypothetical protein FWE63_00875 [Bacteroidales bacterium]|nr:hypothetical protein [Bacteroidales bacterium]